MKSGDYTVDHTVAMFKCSHLSDLDLNGSFGMTLFQPYFTDR